MSDLRKVSCGQRYQRTATNGVRRRPALNGNEMRWHARGRGACRRRRAARERRDGWPRGAALGAAHRRALRMRAMTRTAACRTVHTPAGAALAGRQRRGRARRGERLRRPARDRGANRDGFGRGGRGGRIRAE
ncbi:hypothetical protein BUH_1983 [Burkholderia pseudomallei Pakistan 9]|nr:hypothetical protein BUH_1983 [Burkholderia pseudomallei Pakistan 9]